MVDTSTGTVTALVASRPGSAQGELSVSVDRDFARFGNKSYAINKINSVEVRQRYPRSRVPANVCGLLALITLLAGGGRTGMIILAVIFGGLAYLSWRQSQIVEYQLFLMTSSSETEAISSRDSDVILSLRDRIEQAMAGQLGS